MSVITPIAVPMIGELLDNYRSRHNITSDEKLAARLGVSDVAIYRWRTGKIHKSALLLLAIDRELATTPTLSNPPHT